MPEYTTLRERIEANAAEQLARARAAARPHDWPEDYAHENGQYVNICIVCSVQFVGHKRRHVCRPHGLLG